VGPSHLVVPCQSVSLLLGSRDCTLCPPRFKSTLICDLQQIHPIPLGAEITIDAYIDSPKSPEYLPARLTWNA